MNFDGAKVTVMGLGRFGGGVGVTKWLVAQGAQVLVTDLEKAEALKDSMAQIESVVRQGSVTLRLGEHNVSDFTTCDVVVANPAVPKPWDNRFLRAASAAGVRVTTEIGLLVNHLPRGAVSIGITASAGHPAAAPVQVSATSQGPATSRQVVPAPAKVATHVALVPAQ